METYGKANFFLRVARKLRPKRGYVSLGVPFTDDWNEQD